MPLFASSSPFDADVEKATNEKNTSEDWALIMDICDQVGRQHNGARECLKSIAKRLNHKVPFVVLQALTLLDACVNNCGRAFHLEVSSRDFITEIRSLLGQKVHPKVVQKMKFLIKKWSEMPEIKNDRFLSLLPSLYEALRREGADFTDPDAAPGRPVDPASDAAREEDDIARAIALSLEQAEKAEQAKKSGLSSATCSTTYPMLPQDLVVKGQELNRVRALYDFEAAEDNELTFKAGEIISVTDDSDSNWWKGFDSRGEGLFPSNFVTADLSVEPNKSENEVTAQQGKEGVEISLDMPENVEINEGLIDEVLAMIQNADPADETKPDTPEMLRLEATCKAMGPLIDCELQRVDRDYSRLLELNRRVTEALQMYHNLMQENPAYSGRPPAQGPLASSYPYPLIPRPATVDTASPQFGQPAMYGGQQSYFGTPGMMPMGTPAAVPSPAQTPSPGAVSSPAQGPTAAVPSPTQAPASAVSSSSPQTPPSAAPPSPAPQEPVSYPVFAATTDTEAAVATTPESSTTTTTTTTPGPTTVITTTTTPESSTTTTTTPGPTTITTTTTPESSSTTTPESTTTTTGNTTGNKNNNNNISRNPNNSQCQATTHTSHAVVRERRGPLQAIGLLLHGRTSPPSC